MRPFRSARFTSRIAAAVGVLAVVAGCSSDELPRFGMPEPVTDKGPRILSLWQGSWITAFIVGGLVWGLILWTVVFHRRRRGDTGLPPQVRYNIPIEVLYTIAPVIAVAVLFFFTARDESAILELTDNPAHTVNVVGKQWSWDFNYADENAYETGTTARPPTLYLPIGERIRFEVTGRDVIHSFFVPAFLYKMDTIPGRVNRFEVTPTKLGTFRGKCAELCGQDHARMLFNVRIVNRADFDRHIDELRARGQTGELPAEELGPDLGGLSSDDGNGAAE